LNLDSAIERRQSTDDTARGVFADAEGQHVVGDDGEKVRVQMHRLAVVAFAALVLLPGCGPKTDEDHAALAVRRLGGQTRRIGVSDEWH